MIALWLDDEGPGSYESIREYIEGVLKDNCYTTNPHEPWSTEEEARKRLSGAMTYSILYRLGARGNECKGRSNDEMVMTYE